jgi:hypothetical protein
MEILHELVDPAQFFFLEVSSHSASLGIPPVL